MSHACFKPECCKDRACWCPTVGLLILITLSGLFMACLVLVSLYTHPDTYLKAMKANWNHIAAVVVSYLVVLCFLYFLVMVMWKITTMFRKAYALMKICSNPLDFIGNRVDTKAVVAEDPAVHHYLNKKMHIVTPEFLRAWVTLRDHIQRWELRYFYELTSPIISLEIVFVLLTMVMALIGLFQDDYDGDIRLFLVNLVSQSNIIMIL